MCAFAIVGGFDARCSNSLVALSAVKPINSNVAGDSRCVGIVMNFVRKAVVVDDADEADREEVLDGGERSPSEILLVPSFGGVIREESRFLMSVSVSSGRIGEDMLLDNVLLCM
jgi:hypothetical protein